MKPVGTSKKVADKRLTALLHQFETGCYVKPTKGTLAELLERWLRDYAYINLSPRTAESYESIIKRHIIPSLGHLNCMQLSPEMVQEYITEKLTSGRINGEGGLSAMTVKHHIVCLHTVLQYAVKLGLLFRNPADAVTIPKASRTEMKIMNEEGIRCFLDIAQNKSFYPIFYLAIFTGMRRSELLALRWQDVDFVNSQLSISRTLHKKRGGSFVFRQPKTEKSRRLVALTPSTIDILNKHREEQVKLRKSLDQKELCDNDLIFCDYDGSPISPDRVTQNWIKTARAANIHGVRLHDARHTHASLMLKQGVHPKIVQERLGHSSIQVTLDTYSHVTPGLQENAARAFDNVVLVKS